MVCLADYHAALVDALNAVESETGDHYAPAAAAAATLTVGESMLQAAALHTSTARMCTLLLCPSHLACWPVCVAALYLVDSAHAHVLGGHTCSVHISVVSV